MLLDLIFAVFCMIYIWRCTNCSLFPSPQFILISGYFFYYYLGLILNHNEPFISGSEHSADLVWLTRSGFLVIFAASMITKNWQTLKFGYYRDKFFTLSRVDDIWLSKHLYPLWALMIFIIFTYLILIPVQPILVMLTNPSGLLEARESVTVSFNNFGFFSNFFNEFIPITWMLLLLYGKRFAGISLLLLNLLVLLSTGQKSPIVYILILYILSVSFIKGQIDYGQTIRYGLVVFISLIMLVYYQNAHLLGALNWEAVSLSITGLVRRIFFIGPETVLGFLTTFPDFHPFLFGADTDIPADKIVYRTIIGSDIDGTMNSNSLAFFYAWVGNKYIASLLYFLTIMLFFITPAMLGKLSFPRNLAIVSFLIFSLLLVKFNMTDWYTIYFIFVLSLISINGLLLTTRFILNVSSSDIIYRTSIISAVMSVLMLLYFLQGQIRSFIN